MNQSFWIAEACSVCSVDRIKNGKNRMRAFDGKSWTDYVCPHCKGTGIEPQKVEIQDDGDEE